MTDITLVLTPDVVRYTSEIKALVGRTAQNIVQIGEKLQAVKEQLEHGQWAKWLRREFDWSEQTARNMMHVALRFKSTSLVDLPMTHEALYLLAAPSTPTAAADEALTLAQQGEAISRTRAKALVNKHRGVQTLDAYKAAKQRTPRSQPSPVQETLQAISLLDIPPQRYFGRCPCCDGPALVSRVSSAPPTRYHCTTCGTPFTLADAPLLVVEWNAETFPLDETPDDSAPPPAVAPVAPPARPLVLIPDPPPVVNGQRPTFNQTNEMVDWAKWTWNPVTGCLHNCVYCYARDIAERFYPEKFVPTFHPERLKAPHYTKVPPEADDQIGYRNVFVCSMADLFGKWVPQEWIEAVLDEVRAAPQWNFLFLTKFPQRLAEIDWPANAWVGTTVDEQYRVEIAERAFRTIEAPVKWLSCEPLREQLTFTSLDMFDWVVLGGQSASTQAPAFQPPWAWVEHLWQQARAAQCLVYWKPNLHTRPQEYPTGTLLHHA